VYESGSRLLRRRTQHVAVQGTWLAIPPGQCFALLGPNGAGKTTTISCLTGLTRPTSGDALIAGHSISSPGGVDRVRASLGVCFQFDVLWPKLTGREHMELVAAMRGLEGREGREQVEELLQQVGLAGHCGGRNVRMCVCRNGWKLRLSAHQCETAGRVAEQLVTSCVEFPQRPTIPSVDFMMPLTPP
jgi:ABC-type multidrug transport system ATPase subunit